MIRERDEHAGCLTRPIPSANFKRLPSGKTKQNRDTYGP